MQMTGKREKIAFTLGMEASFLRRHCLHWRDWLALIASHTGALPYSVKYVANQHGLTWPNMASFLAQPCPQRHPVLLLPSL